MLTIPNAICYYCMQRCICIVHKLGYTTTVRSFITMRLSLPLDPRYIPPSTVRKEPAILSESSASLLAAHCTTKEVWSITTCLFQRTPASRNLPAYAMNLNQVISVRDNTSLPIPFLSFSPLSCREWSDVRALTFEKAQDIHCSSFVQILPLSIAVPATDSAAMLGECAGTLVNTAQHNKTCFTSIITVDMILRSSTYLSRAIVSFSSALSSRDTRRSSEMRYRQVRLF